MKVVRDSMRNSQTVMGRRRLMWLGTAICASALAACQPERINRGYRPKPGALAQVSEGMTKSDVESILGSPSTKASVNLNGDSYYYISSVTEGRAFMRPTEVSREVIAIRFDQQDQVSSVAQYALEDGRVININSRQTPVVGQELNILQELFRGAAKGGSPLGLGRKL